MSGYPKERIAVLAGGPSSEREVSLVSGRAVYEALLSKGLDALILDPVEGFIDRLREEKISMVFIALHGAFGEDGTIQRMLDEAGICYTGSGAQASQAGFDKVKTQKILKEKGVLIPRHLALRDNVKFEKASWMRLPLVVKPSKAGSSVGISIVRDWQMLDAAIEEALRHSEEALIEEYIQGRELTVGLLGGEALPVVEVIAQRSFYDYEAKYGNAGTRYEFPAKLTSAESRQAQETARLVYEALGCEVMGRVDMILGRDGQFYTIEINTIPGLTGKSLLPKAAQAKGIPFDELCVRIIDLSRQKTGSAIYGKTR
jgi:D-alanine-D-alanine ligase